MFKLQNKIFVFTCLLYSLCNKSHSVLIDAFLIQLVAPRPPPTILFSGSTRGSASDTCSNTSGKRGMGNLFDQFMEPWSQWQPSWTIPHLPWFWQMGGSPEETQICLQHISKLHFPFPFLFMPHNKLINSY